MRKFSWFLVLAFMAFACDMPMGEETPAPANLNAEMATFPSAENEFYSVTLLEPGVASGNYFQWTWKMEQQDLGQAISHVNFSGLGTCASIQDIVSYGYSTDGSTFTNSTFDPSLWKPDPSLGKCNLQNVNNLKFAVEGNVVYFRLILSIQYGVGFDNEIIWKSGSENEFCDKMTIPGIGCIEAGGTVYEIICEGTPAALAGATVELYQPTTATTPVTQVTKSDGTYLFTNLGSTPYKIVVPGAAPAEGFTRTGTSYGNDFTFYYYELGGYVFDNTCGTKVAVADVTVTLKLGTETIGTAVTTLNGYFVFPKLVKGDYSLSAEGYGTLNVTDLSSCLYDKELVKMIYEISGTVMQETCFDPTPGVSLPVILKSGETTVATANTDESGFYKFGSLAAGAYSVYVAGADPDTKPVELKDGLCMINLNFTMPNKEVCEKCYDDETAWAAGGRYGKGNWATYTSYSESKITVDLFAGKNINVGSATLEPYNGTQIKVTFNLTNGWTFFGTSDNVHVQDYMIAPSSNPAPGQFEFKDNAEGTSFSMYVDKNKFYGIHAVVGKEIPCTQ